MTTSLTDTFPFLSGSAWAPVVVNGIRVGVPASFGGAVYGGYQFGDRYIYGH